MKQIITIVLFSICLFGCSNRNTNRDKDLEQSLIEVNDLLESQNRVMIAKYDFETESFQERNTLKFKLITKLHKQVDTVISDIKKYYADSTKDTGIDELIVKYNNVIDTLKKYKKKHTYSELDSRSYGNIIHKDYKKMKLKQADKLIALEMIGNIERNERPVYGQIFTFGTDDSWDIITQKFNEIENTKNKSYSLGLQSDLYMRCPVKYILIDTIYKDGIIIKVPHSVKLNNFFATINFDSLSKGSYEIKGEIKRHNINDYDYIDKFSNKFEIKK